MRRPVIWSGGTDGSRQWRHGGRGGTASRSDPPASILSRCLCHPRRLQRHHHHLLPLCLPRRLHLPSPSTRPSRTAVEDRLHRTPSLPMTTVVAGMFSTTLAQHAAIDRFSVSWNMLCAHSHLRFSPESADALFIFSVPGDPVATSF